MKMRTLLELYDLDSEMQAQVMEYHSKGEKAQAVVLAGFESKLKAIIDDVRGKKDEA